MDWSIIGEIATAHGPELLLGAFALAAVLACGLSRSSIGRQLRLEAQCRQLVTSHDELLRINETLLDEVHALETRFEALRREQQTTQLRSAKPDLQIARSLAQSGASVEQLRDCGLSAGEAHLVSAMSSRRAATA